jgi:hypothetical protein
LLVTLGCNSYDTAPADEARSLSTGAYLEQLDLELIQDRGTDYATCDRQSDPDVVIDQRFRDLEYVDRGQALKEIFHRVTARARTETEREEAVVQFARKLSIHNFQSALIGIPIFDPLILIETNVMDCQKVSRLIADIYSAAGYDSRLVDMYGHVVAEVKYDGSWHYADADMFGGPQVVKMPDGRIPSVAELSLDYSLLDRLQVYLENDVLFSYCGSGAKTRENSPWSYPSYVYFSKEYHSRHPGFPCYVYKLNQRSTIDSRMFGWDEVNGDVRREFAADIVLSDIPETLTPMAPSIRRVSTSGSSVEIAVAEQGHAHIAGFKACVSKASRGWDYGRFMGETSARRYWANPSGWRSEMYDNLFTLPSTDVAEVESLNPNIVVRNLTQGRYYISIMAIDRYGAEIGKQLYPLSNEIVVDVAR